MQNKQQPMTEKGKKERKERRKEGKRKHKHTTNCYLKFDPFILLFTLFPSFIEMLTHLKLFSHHNHQNHFLPYNAGMSFDDQNHLSKVNLANRLPSIHSTTFSLHPIYQVDRLTILDTSPSLYTVDIHSTYTQENRHLALHPFQMESQQVKNKTNPSCFWLHPLQQLPWTHLPSLLRRRNTRKVYRTHSSSTYKHSG